MTDTSLTPIDIEEIDSLPEFLREQIEVTDGHARWIGPTTTITAGDGAFEYGRVSVDGKRQYSHRIIFNLLRGKGRGALRRLCDEALCQSPAHWLRIQSLWTARRTREQQTEQRLLRKLHKTLDEYFASAR